MASSEQGHLLSVPEKPRIIYAEDPKDYTLWDNNKDTLRVLYLDENCSLKEVKRRMETECQFPILPLSEYETVLRDHFHFRKKVGRSDWGPIGYRIEKRKRAGKDSQVYLGLKLLASDSVAKEVRRYKLKGQISSRIRQGLSPPLPENIIIRTPSPQPRQHVVTMHIDHTTSTSRSMLADNAIEYDTNVSKGFVVIDVSAMVDKHARLEAINAIRLQSPFNGFVTLLHKLVSPTPSNGHSSETRSKPANYSVLVETANSSHSTKPPAHNTESESLETPSVPDADVPSNPSQLVLPENTVLPAMLAQACYAVSNRHDSSAKLTSELFKWISIEAEPSDLKSFFSIETYTVTAIWENLVDSSLQLGHRDVFKLLIDSALSIGRRQWLLRRYGDILCKAVEWRMVQTAQRLLTLGIPPDNLCYGHNEMKGTPLQNAVATLQTDMIRVLCQYGADVNLQPFKSTANDYKTWTKAPLFIVIDAVPKQCHFNEVTNCARILLEYGAQVDICRNSRARHCRGHSSETQDLGLLVEEWFSDQGSQGCRPQWCTDYAWVRLGRDHELVHILLESSSRAQNHVTVPGIVTSARKGLTDLNSYLRERESPAVIHDTSALLEIALSWTADLGNLEALICLLQFGVDPNVGTISCFLEHMEARHWLPVSRTQSEKLVSILKDHGANERAPRPTEPRRTEKHHEIPRPTEPRRTEKHHEIPRQTTLDIVYQALIQHQSSLERIELSDSDIKNHGDRLLELFLSHADRTNFGICARMCDFLWSRNVPKDIKWDGGKNCLHLAVGRNCCIEMCGFLVGRGYQLNDCFTGHVSDSLFSATMLGDAVKRFNTSPEDSVELIDFLLKHGASMDTPVEGPTLLESVLGLIRLGIRSIFEVRKLFEKLMALGASVDPPPGRHVKPERPLMSVLCSLLKYGYEDDFIFRVINKSEGVDQQGDPLAMALQNGRIAVVDRLLLRGAKVNHPPRKDFRGILQTACSPLKPPDTRKKMIIHARLVERLIKLGADVNGIAQLVTGGSTPLQHAAYEGKIEVACLLLKHGADVNGGGRGPKEKATRPLDYAAGYGRLDMVHLLRSAGAISAHPGQTGVDGAIRCAEEGHHYSISDYLRSTIDRGNI